MFRYRQLNLMYPSGILWDLYKTLITSYYYVKKKITKQNYIHFISEFEIESNDYLGIDVNDKLSKW